MSSVRGRGNVSEIDKFFWGVESKESQVERQIVLADFANTVEYNGEKRYVTQLNFGKKQFQTDHNRLVMSRVESTTKTVVSECRLKGYDDVLVEQVGKNCH